MKLKRVLALLTLVFLTLSPPSEAKELFGRLGLGYNAQFTNSTLTNGTPALSLKYGLAPRTELEIIAGFYSGTNGSGVAALKFERTLRSESYANFYFLLGLGSISAQGRSGTELLGGLGSEFFIPGVDNIGISFEAGVSAENLSASSGTYILKTFGASFVNAGMHYYF